MTSRQHIHFQCGVQLIEEHGFDTGGEDGHRLTVGRLEVNRFDLVEGHLPGSFLEGTTTALGDRKSGVGTTIAYPVYKFTEGKVFGRQTVEFIDRADVGRAAVGKWTWNGGTGAFDKIRGEGSVEAKVIVGPGNSQRRVVDYVGTYWFE